MDVDEKDLEEELRQLMGEAKVEGFGDCVPAPLPLARDSDGDSDEEVSPKAIKQPKVTVYQPGAEVLDLWNKRTVLPIVSAPEGKLKRKDAKKEEKRLANYRIGTEYFLDGDFQQAISYFKAVTSNGSLHYRDAINYLGQSYESVQSYQEALNCYKAITTKDSTNMNLRCRIAFLHTELGNFQEASKAVAALDKVAGGKELEYDLDVRLLKVRVKCGIMQGKFADALRELGKFFTRRFAVDFQFVFFGATQLYLMDELSFALDCFLAFIIKCFLVLEIAVDERVMNAALAKCRFKNCSQSHWGTDYLIDNVDLTLAIHYAVDILLGQDISNNSLAGSLLSTLHSTVNPESTLGLDVRLMQAVILMRKRDDTSAAEALSSLNSIFVELDAIEGIIPSQIPAMLSFFFTSSYGMHAAEILNTNNSVVFSKLDDQTELSEITDGDDFKFLIKQIVAAIKELKRFGRISVAKRRMRHLITSLQQKMSFNKGLMSRVWCDVSSLFDRESESCEHICCVLKAVETSDILEAIPVRIFSSFAMSHGSLAALALAMNADHFTRLHNLLATDAPKSVEDDVNDDELWGASRSKEEVKTALQWCKLLWQTGDTQLYLTVACALLDCAITQYRRGDAMAMMTVPRSKLGKLYRRLYITSTILKPRIWLDHNRDKYRRLLRLFGNQFHLKSYFMEDFLGIISLLREARQTNEVIGDIYLLHLKDLIDEAEEAMNHKFRLQTMLTHNMLVDESEDASTVPPDTLPKPPSHVLNPAVKNAFVFKKKTLPQTQSQVSYPQHIEQVIRDPTNLGKANICVRTFLHDLHEHSDMIKFPRSFYKHNAEVFSVQLLQGHLLKKNGEHSEAINAYINALRSSSEQPVTYLCLSAYALCAVQHRSFTGMKSDLLGKAIALLNLYKDRREACKVQTESLGTNEEGGKEYCTSVALEQEILYNFGRSFQEVNLLSLAHDCYAKALALADAHPTLLVNGSINVTRESAHNLTLILKKSRRLDLAIEVAHKYLTL